MTQRKLGSLLIQSNCFNTYETPLTENDCNVFATTSSNYSPELLCTEDDILELLFSLDITKANGPDNISAVMLKATAPTLLKE